MSGFHPGYPGSSPGSEASPFFRVFPRSLLLLLYTFLFESQPQEHWNCLAGKSPEGSDGVDWDAAMGSTAGEAMFGFQSTCCPHAAICTLTWSHLNAVCMSEQSEVS